ncbi:GDSL-type esterase/lipase family protein [Chitinophaga sp. Cy-1792]|uniref:GDSL-type esterase/lipase family protein n=1 Tax=Chitinophaga sp. Cy-1792 TaxID=2608339 RepID=UPI001423F097|nr:GDSL-type esterase/lipase family protein [Chitinophaga sp. Cy-1792]NIG52997.1 G-D-S-L family lipolytic protein [Chitinophaga sp. Cy-1792]
MKKILFTAFCSCFILLTAFAQQYPYHSDIQAFKRADSLNKPAGNEILFIGSSSFTYWTDVQNYFPDKKIINRGFGGSTLLNQLHYADDVIFAYHPKQIVIYCGENDLADADTVTADSVLHRFQTLFTMIRNKMPTVPIVYVSLKPSPSRARLMEKMVAANDSIRKYLRKQRRTAFVDVYHQMLNADGTIKAELFKEDQLHMKAAGYAIWQKAIAPALK